MPIYCNHNTLLMIPSIEGYESYIKQAELKEMKKDKTKEEIILEEIVQSCNTIADQIVLGAEPTDADYNSLGYILGAISSIKNNLIKDLDNQIANDVRSYKNS